MSQTIRVFAGHTNAGKAFQESIQVEELPGKQYRVLSSPGYANGFAAGDVLELLDSDGRFRVIGRAGNICVQIFVKGDKETAIREFGWRFGALDGWLDGGSDGEAGHLLIYTIPFNAGFPAIERVFEGLPQNIGLDTWMYGNVYDDNGAALNWWTTERK